MKTILFSLFLAGGFVASASAETLKCSFDVTDRYKPWVPDQLELIRDRDYGRDRVSADLFRQSGTSFVRAKITHRNETRTTFGFKHSDPSVKEVDGSRRVATGMTQYSLTVYSDKRRALLKAKTKQEYVLWDKVHVTAKGTCVEK